jgi:hypothetical protein
VQLIHDLRQCDTYPEYRDFQEELPDRIPPHPTST